MGKCCYTNQGEKFGQIDIAQQMPYMKSVTIPTLEYFDGRFDGQLQHGRAMPIRMLLWYTNVNYKDERISYEEFEKRKKADAYKFGTLPVMTIPH